MSATKRLLAILSFIVILGGTACDEAARPPQAAEPPLVSEVVSVGEPLAQAGGEECSCGHFVDEDGDGVCDLAASGECRRARDGRCPCGGGCPGCL